MMLEQILKWHARRVSRDMPVRIRLRTAYHEAGHAFFMASDPLWKNVRIKLVAGGGLAAASYSNSDEIPSPQSAWKIIKMLLAGVVVEQYFFDGYSKYGTMQDLASALELAAKHQEGLLEISANRDVRARLSAVSELISAGVNDDCRTIIATAIAECMDEVCANRSAIRTLGKCLYREARVCDSDIRRILGVVR